MGGSAWRHPFADVHEETTDGQRRRITTLHADLGTGDSALRQTAALNRILKSLDDSRVLAADTVERVEGRLRLISAATEARPLGERIVERPLSLRAAVHVLVQVCETLEAAHGLGVIHGTLTPASVLLDGDDDAPSVVVTDFGLAHVVTGTELGEGDPRWSPITPEKLLGERPVAATDVYLLGALAYALLLGRPVYEGDSAEVVQRSHSIEEPPALSELDPNLPWALSSMVAKCLVKEPEERFERPSAFADALVAFLNAHAEPTAVSDHLYEDEPHTMIVRPIHRTPSGEVAVTAPDPSAIDEDAATRAMTLRDPLPAPKPQAAASPDKSRSWVAPVMVVGLLAAAGVGYVMYDRYASVPVDVAAETSTKKTIPADESSARPQKSEPSAQADVNDDGEPGAGRGENESPGRRPKDPSSTDNGATRASAEEPVPADDAAQFLEEDDSGDDDSKRDAQSRVEAQGLVVRAAEAQRAGRHDEALRLYGKALEVHPNYAPAAHGLAGIHYIRGEYQRAVEYGRIAVSSAPSSGEYYVRLGDAYRELGDDIKARVHWKRAAKLGSREADERLEQ